MLKSCSKCVSYTHGASRISDYFVFAASTNESMYGSSIFVLLACYLLPDSPSHLYLCWTRYFTHQLQLSRDVHSCLPLVSSRPFLIIFVQKSDHEVHLVCAIASRYYAEKSEIYPIAMHFAKHSAANALIDGWKSVELCQAYILMSTYAVPARRWEEDRSWLYTGLAIR